MTFLPPWRIPKRVDKVKLKSQCEAAITYYEQRLRRPEQNVLYLCYLCEIREYPELYASIVASLQRVRSLEQAVADVAYYRGISPRLTRPYFYGKEGFAKLRILWLKRLKEKIGER